MDNSSAVLAEDVGCKYSEIIAKAPALPAFRVVATSQPEPETAPAPEGLSNLQTVEAYAQILDHHHGPDKNAEDHPGFVLSITD